MDFTRMLPDETLSHVFAWAQVIDPHASAMDHTLGRRAPKFRFKLGWIHVSFVDRRWRCVAIDEATLWTEIDGRLGLRWTTEFLNRSKDTLLSFADRQPSGLRKRILRDALTMHRDRVVSLRMGATIDEEDSLSIFDELAFSFAKLQELDVVHSFYGLVSEEQCRPIDPFLKNCCPQLYHLSLSLPHSSFSYLTWDYPFLTHLTSLSIHFGRVGARFQAPPFPDSIFLKAMRQMTSLSQLTLRGNNVTDPNELYCEHCHPARPENVIHLESLRFLTVIARTEVHAHLLHHIRVSPRARVSLLDTAPSEQQLVHEALGDAFMQLLDHRRLEAPNFRSGYLLFRKETVTLGLDRTTQPSLPADLVKIKKHLNEEGGHRGWTGSNDLTISLIHGYERFNTLSMLPIDDVRTLVMDFADIYASESKGTAKENPFGGFLVNPRGFGARAVPPHTSSSASFFPSVQCLSIDMHRNQRLTHVIRLLEDTNVLPALRVLDLRGHDFDLLTAITCLTLEGPRVLPTRTLVLTSALDARRKKGIPVQTIYLHIAEEEALIRKGRISGTRCRKLREDVVLESIRRLKAVPGVVIVSEEFNVFQG
ncbi:unnamed protein product [Peniophora sp. CBMAI 1063]|nr:unnamed protein product [Peniophora sp. CBMAI 1063]